MQCCNRLLSSYAPRCRWCIERQARSDAISSYALDAKVAENKGKFVFDYPRVCAYGSRESAWGLTVGDDLGAGESGGLDHEGTSALNDASTMREAVR